MSKSFFLRDADSAVRLMASEPDAAPAEGEAAPAAEGQKLYKLFPKKTLHHPMSEEPILLDTKFFSDMAKTFADRGLDIMVDFNHNSSGAFSREDGAAAGWITSLTEKEDGLYASIEWTERGQQAVKSKEYRYLSPEWTSSQYDQNSGAAFSQPRLLAVALTNRPYLEKQKPLAASESVTKKEVLMSDQNAKELEDLRAAKAQAEQAAAKNAEALAAVLKFQRDVMMSTAMSEGRMSPAMMPDVQAFADACGSDLGKFKSFLDKLPAQFSGQRAAQGQTVEQSVPAVDTTKLSESDKRAAKLWGHTAEDVAKFGDWIGIQIDPKTNKKFYIMADGRKVEA